MSAELTFIGHIQTPYTALEDCPNNIRFDGPICQLVLAPEYHEELTGLTAGQHILILYWLENAERSVARKQLNFDERHKGTFALRSPHRPNPIGATVLPIEQIEAGVVRVRGLDCLNGTRLLDIKPAIGREVAPAKPS